MVSTIQNPISLTGKKRDSTLTLMEYRVLKSGLLTSSGGLDSATAFLKTKSEEPSPDVQLQFYCASMDSDLARMINIDQKIVDHFNWTSAQEGFTALPTLLRPKSAGTIRLRSTDPFEYPVIDPNYLSHPDDVKTLIRGVRVVQKLHQTKAFKEIGAKLNDRRFPTCTTMKYDTDAYWECYIRALAVTVYHPTTTCKMGKPSDPTTVVDPQLRNYLAHCQTALTFSGFSRSQVSIGNGERMSTSKRFLWQVIDRPNLHVLANSHVTKVMIENKKAVGVEYIKDGRLHRVRASREVILSAGAIGSPQLLMLSGIGPKKHLEEMKVTMTIYPIRIDTSRFAFLFARHIGGSLCRTFNEMPVQANLPVGESLHDHLFVPVVSTIQKPITLTEKKRESTLTLMEYRVLKSGLLTSSGGLEATAFLKTKSEEPRPDIQLQFYCAYMDSDLARVMNIDQKIVDHFNWTSAQEGFTALPTLLRPKSVGTIRLRRPNPFEYPVIDPNYLSRPDDVKTLIRGVRVVQKLYQTKAFKEIGAKPNDRSYPTWPTMKYDTDAYWECYIRALAVTVYHPTTTCKMGKSSDPTTVVDPELRVKGIAGLRVVDASIMPAVVSGNANAPSVMIGEKAADIIKSTK